MNSPANPKPHMNPIADIEPAHDRNAEDRGSWLLRCVIANDDPALNSLSCDGCERVGLVGTFPHLSRHGDLLCGECWVERELAYELGRRVRRILSDSRAYKRNDLETLALIQREAARGRP